MLQVSRHSLKASLVVYWLSRVSLSPLNIMCLDIPELNLVYGQSPIEFQADLQIENEDASKLCNSEVRSL